MQERRVENLIQLAKTKPDVVLYNPIIMPKIPATQKAEEDHKLKTNLENLKEIMS